MTLIIAEIGINHNGSFDIAKKLIDAAKYAGADAVKFQKRTIELVYAGHLDDPRESPWGNTNGDQKRGLEFGKDQYDQIASYCALINMLWFASAWDVPSLEFLSKYDCPYNKIASAMNTNMEFIDAVAKEHKPVFLSTGMATIEEIQQAVIRLGFDPWFNKQITVMHCVGVYPCPEEDLNLNVIPLLAKKTDCPVGYSGHETSVSPSVIAVVLGAVAIERHITLDRSMYGSDQAASLEPVGFKSMVDQIRKIPAILGDGVKRITEGEKAVARKLRYWL